MVMDPIENEGTNLLAPLRGAEPAGPPAVDIAKARVAGRRQSRRRVIAGMAAAASLVVVAAVGVPALINNAPDATTPAGQTFGLDVLKRIANVGSAGGFTPDTYETRRDRQIIRLKRAGGGQGTATVEVMPPVKAPYPPAYPNLGDRTDDVNGREAYWIEPGPVLAWSWTKEAWATVSWENVPEPDVKVLIHRVAQSVKPAESPVTVPFRISLEDGLTLESVQVSTSSPVSSVVLSRFSPDGVYQSITAGLMPAEPGLSANDQVSGHPAYTSPTMAKILDTGHGVQAYATMEGTKPDIDLLKLVATTIVAVDNPDDQATWVPDLVYKRAR
jgi:hypothetical protein